MVSLKEGSLFKVREIGRGVGYRKCSEQLSGYPTIQSAMEGGFSKLVNKGLLVKT